MPEASYQAVRRALRAADSLAIAAQVRIETLEREGFQCADALEQQRAVSQYDVEEYNRKMIDWQRAQNDLAEANRVITRIRDALPRRYHRLASVSPAATLECLTDYQYRLRRRSWRMGGIGLAIGILVPFFLR
jgi:hypothetical protein